MRRLTSASLRFAPVLLWACFTAPLEAQRALAGSRPNVIFLYSDDHASHAISAYGSRRNLTPHLDRIAAEGVRFQHAFCGNALCGPARATILTGKHSHAHGFLRNGNRFDGAQTTLPKLLQQAGYRTAIVGKWHLESDPVGFDHWMVLPGQGQYYNPDFLTPDGRRRLEGHVTDITMDLALDRLERRDRERPLLLLCQFKAPHRNWMPAPDDLGLYRDGDLPEPPTLFDDHAGRTPALRAQEMEIARHLFLHYDLLVPPREGAVLQGEDRAYPGLRARMTPAQRAAWDAAYGAEDEAFQRAGPEGEDRVRWYYQRYIKNYLRCVAGIDRNVGRLLRWLDLHPDVKANTLLVYCSDQGFFLGEHGFYDKRWMYEESLRMPLLVSWPGAIAQGREVSQLVQNIDVMPTLLDLAGVPVPADVHGRSLLPLLEGRDDVPWRDAIYYHYYESHSVHMVPAMYGVRTARHKLIRYYEPPWDGIELFDLAADPHELRSIAGDPAHAAVRADLERRLRELRDQYGDDTGEIAAGEFPVQAGIARVRRGDGTWTVWAAAQQSYLLRTGERSGTVALATTMRPAAGAGAGNGYVVVAGGDPRGARVFAGIEFDKRRLVVLGPDGERADGALAWDGGTAVALRVTVDLAAHRIVVAAGGQRVEAALPEQWSKLTAWGFGASNTETEFGELRLD